MFLSKVFLLSELDINQILKLKYYFKRGGQKKLMEIVLAFTFIETQKVQLFW